EARLRSTLPTRAAPILRTRTSRVGPPLRPREASSSGNGGWAARLRRSRSRWVSGGPGSAGLRCDGVVTWTSPGALWLLAAVPLVWIALRFARTTFNPRQRRLQAAARSLLLVALAFAIARPVLSTSSPRHSIVYAVDISHSISTKAIEDAARKIDDLNRAASPDHWRIVAFGRTAAVVADTAALRALA